MSMEDIQHFEAPSDLLQYIKETPVDPSWGPGGSQRESVTGTQSFTASKSIEEAYGLAENGWPEGLEKIAQRMGMQPSFGRGRVRLHDVAGDLPDIGAFLAGSPLSMTRRIAALTTRQPVLDLVVNVAFYCGTTTDAMMNYGAAVAGMVDELEGMGFSLNLQVSCVALVGSSTLGTVLTIKRAGEPLEMGRLVFFMAHPSYFRRFVFAHWETKMTRSELAGRSYGVPRDLTGVGESALYFPSNNNLNHDCRTPDDARAYVRGVIRKQRPDLLDEQLGMAA